MYMSYKFVDSFRTGAYAPTRKLSTYVYDIYEGWNFNSGNYLFTTDTK